MLQANENNSTGHDKIERYGWTKSDKPGKLMFIPKTALSIPEEYQRTHKPFASVKIAKNWSWLHVGALTVGYRDGEYWVIDGQHRLLAALRRSDIFDLPCVVFNTDSIKDEADAFLGLNTGRAPVSSIDKYHAGLAALDENCLYVEMLLEDYDIQIKQTCNKKGETKSIEWILTGAKKDRNRLGVVLEVARDFCESYMPKNILAGLWMLDERLNTKYGIMDTRFLKRLFKVGEAIVLTEITRSNAIYKSFGAISAAHGILEAVNKGLRNKFRMQIQGEEK